MAWLELRISSNREDAPGFDEALVAIGAHAVTLQDNADHPIFEPALGETPLWQDTLVIGLFDADIDTSFLEKQLPLNDGIYFVWRLVEDKDWEREWMRHYHPIQCGERLWICPSWRDVPDPSATNILLDPGLAFGTGTHPTTFLCLQWLSTQRVTGQSILDYGCGSGILGLAALLLGAQSVSGVDIDPQALLATQENTRRNHRNPKQFPVYFPDKVPPDQVDLVFANILAGPLVELSVTLCKHIKPGGKLCLSGILSSQVDEVQTAYKASITFAAPLIKDEWACLVGKKNG